MKGLPREDAVEAVARRRGYFFVAGVATVGGALAGSATPLIEGAIGQGSFDIPIGSLVFLLFFAAIGGLIGLAAGLLGGSLGYLAARLLSRVGVPPTISSIIVGFGSGYLLSAMLYSYVIGTDFQESLGTPLPGALAVTAAGATTWAVSRRSAKPSRL